MSSNLTLAATIALLDEFSAPARQIAELAGTLTDRLKDIGAPAEEAQAAVAGFGSSLPDVGDKLEALGEHLFIDAEALQRFGEMAKHALESVLEPAAKAEDLTRRIISISPTFSFGSYENDRRAIEDFTTSVAKNVPFSREMIDGMLIKARQMGFDLPTSFHLVTDAAKSANIAGADAISTVATLGAAFRAFADPAKDAAGQMDLINDQLAVLGSSGGVNLDALPRSIGKIAETGRDLKIPREQAEALLQTVQRYAFVKNPGAAVEGLYDSLLKAKGPLQELGMNFVKGADGGTDLIGTMAAIRDRLAGLSSTARTAEITKLFGGAAGPAEALMNHIDDARAATDRYAHAGGEAARMNTFLGGGALQTWKELGSAIGGVAEAIGTPMLAPLTTFANAMKPILDTVKEWIKSNPQLMAWSGGLLGVAAAGALGASVLLRVGSGIAIIAGDSIKFVVGVGRMAVALAGYAAQLWAVTAAQWAALGPWVLLAAAIIAGAVLIYEYWGPISSFLTEQWSEITGTFSGAWNWIKSLDWAFIGAALTGPLSVMVLEIYRHWDQIKGVFTGALGWMHDAGVHLIHALAEGIKSLAHLPVDAIKGILGTIWKYLLHSPAQLGPLKDLNRVRIVETIAQTIRPAPAVDAMRRLTQDMAAVSALAFDRELDWTRGLKGRGVTSAIPALLPRLASMEALSPQHFTTEIPEMSLPKFTTEIPEASLIADRSAGRGVSIGTVHFTNNVKVDGGQLAATEEGRQQLVVDILAEIERAGGEFGYQVAKIIERQLDDNERRKTGAGSRQWE